MEIGQLGETGVNVPWHAEVELESATELVQTRRLKMEDLIAKVTAKKKKNATTILVTLFHAQNAISFPAPPLPLSSGTVAEGSAIIQNRNHKTLVPVE